MVREKNVITAIKKVEMNVLEAIECEPKSKNTYKEVNYKTISKIKKDSTPIWYNNVHVSKVSVIHLYISKKLCIKINVFCFRLTTKVNYLYGRLQPK